MECLNDISCFKKRYPNNFLEKKLAENPRNIKNSKNTIGPGIK